MGLCNLPKQLMMQVNCALCGKTTSLVCFNSATDYVHKKIPWNIWLEEFTFPKQFMNMHTILISKLLLFWEWVYRTILLFKVSIFLVIIIFSWMISCVFANIHSEKDWTHKSDPQAHNLIEVRFRNAHSVLLISCPQLALFSLFSAATIRRGFHSVWLTCLFEILSCPCFRGLPF